MSPPFIQAMTVWTQSGEVPAVISRKPIHLLSPEQRKQVVDLADLWLDIGANDKAAASAVVRIGDPITLDLRYRPLRGDLVSGPGMDNKSGMWTVMEVPGCCVMESGPILREGFASPALCVGPG